MSFSRTVEKVTTLVRPFVIRISHATLDVGFEGLSMRTGTLDVADDRPALVVHELDADLGDTTTRAYKTNMSATTP